jgi:hypothetical protein
LASRFVTILTTSVIWIVLDDDVVDSLVSFTMATWVAWLIPVLAIGFAREDQDPSITPHRCFFTSSHANMTTTMADAVTMQSLRLSVASTWSGNCPDFGVVYTASHSTITLVLNGRNVSFKPRTQFGSSNLIPATKVELSNNTGFQVPTGRNFPAYEFTTAVRYPATSPPGAYALFPFCSALIPSDLNLGLINECNYSTPLATPFVVQLGRGDAFQAVLVNLTIEQQPSSLSRVPTWLSIQVELYDDMDFGTAFKLVVNVNGSRVLLPLLKARVAWLANTTTTVLNTTYPITIYHHTLTYGLLLDPYTGRNGVIVTTLFDSDFSILPNTVTGRPLSIYMWYVCSNRSISDLRAQLTGFQALSDTTPPTMESISVSSLTSSYEIDQRANDTESGVASCQLHMAWSGTQGQVLSASVTQTDLLSGTRYSGVFKLSLPLPPMAVDTLLNGTVSCVDYAANPSVASFSAGNRIGVDRTPPTIALFNPTSTNDLRLTWTDTGSGVATCSLTATLKQGGASITQLVNLTASNRSAGEAVVAKLIPGLVFEVQCLDFASNAVRFLLV